MSGAEIGPGFGDHWFFRTAIEFKGASLKSLYM